MSTRLCPALASSVWTCGVAIGVSSFVISLPASAAAHDDRDPVDDAGRGPESGDDGVVPVRKTAQDTQGRKGRALGT